MIGGSEGAKERGSRGKTDNKKNHSGKTIWRRRLQRNINEELTVENLPCREGKKKKSTDEAIAYSMGENTCKMHI